MQSTKARHRRSEGHDYFPMAFHWNCMTSPKWRIDELRIVAAGIDVKLVGNTARVEQLMQLLRSLLESVVVVVAHVEVDLHALEFSRRCNFGKIEDIVALEVGAIDRIAEDVAHHRPWRARASRSEVRAESRQAVPASAR